MAPRKPRLSRRAAVAKSSSVHAQRRDADLARLPATVAESGWTDPDLKTKDVGASDTIRVLKRSAGGIFRSGMTVGEFLSGVPDRLEGLRMLVRSRRAGVIGFVQGRAPTEEAAP